MRKIPVAILLCTLLISSNSKADEKNAVINEQSTFSELSHKLIQNREERLEQISISLKCINSAKDINGMNYCAEAEMSAIRSKMDKFCQSQITGIHETHDYKLFCSNGLNKTSINALEK
jgi:hypothetical protein